MTTLLALFEPIFQIEPHSLEVLYNPSQISDLSQKLVKIVQILVKCELNSTQKAILKNEIVGF